MPAASSWVRGQGGTTEQDAAATVCTAKPATAQARTGIKAQHFSPHHATKKRKVASSGTWKPGDSQPLPIKRAKPANVDAKPGKGSNSRPPKTSAKCKEDADALRIKEEIEQKMQEMEEIKRKREKIEAHQLLKAASALQKEQEQQIRARNEVASIAQAMESSEKLQQRRQQFEVEHKEELRVEQEQKASRAKQVEAEVQQRQVIAHVLKQHQSHYDVLQIAQTSTSADISKAWKRLSKVVHPDRCKLPRADEAFIKIKASVDALQSTGA